MATCWVCVPSCEKCKPKKVACPACGAENLFHAAACASCGHLIGDCDRACARREWEARLAAAQYSAFAQNALMSVLFVALYCRRRGPAGQSMVIAAAKWAGTLAPTIQHGFLYGVNEYVLLMGAICFVWDVAYIALLARAKRGGEGEAVQGGAA